MLNLLKKYSSTIFIALVIPLVVFFAINQANINSLKGQLSLNQLKSRVNENLIDGSKNYCNDYKSHIKSYMIEERRETKEKLIETLINLNINLSQIVDPNSLSDSNYKLNDAELMNLNGIYDILCKNPASKLPAFRSEIKNPEVNLKNLYFSKDNNSTHVHTNARTSCLEKYERAIISNDNNVILNEKVGDCIKRSDTIKYKGELNFELQITPNQKTKYIYALTQGDQNNSLETLLNNANQQSSEKATPSNGKIKIEFDGLCNGLKCQKDYQFLYIKLISEDNKFKDLYLLALEYDENFVNPNETSTKLSNQNGDKIIQGTDGEVKLEIKGTKKLEFIKLLLCDNSNCSGEKKRQLYGYCYEDFNKAEKACNSIEKSDDKLGNNYSKKIKYKTNDLTPDSEYYIIGVVYDEEGNKTQDQEKITIRENNIAIIPDQFDGCQNYFVDMTPFDPECEATLYLRKKGLFMGQNINGQIFANLNAELLRAEYFALSSRLLQFKNPNNNPSIASRFIDITPNITSNPNNYWWLLPLGELIQNNIINGYNDNTIRPYERITQAELAKITGMARGIFAPGSINLNNNPWYKDIVQAYQNIGININPEAIATRRDAVRLIFQSSTPRFLMNN